MKNDSLGNRMKTYEDVASNFLIKKMPVIIRVDGKAFHTFTRSFEKPFDITIRNAMIHCAFLFSKEAQNVQLAYIQSDEISFFLKDYDKIETQSWFRNKIQKISSISASMITAYFNSYIFEKFNDQNKFAMFDSRCFNLPQDEVINYFIWRQQDCVRNSVQSVAQSQFSHKSLHGLNNSQLQEKLFQERNINWNNLPTWQKRGIVIRKTENGFTTDFEIPTFTQDRNYIENLVKLNASLV